MNRDNIRDQDAIKKKETNFDRITKSPAELVTWLICPYKHKKKGRICSRYTVCENCIIDWLNQEVE